MRMSGYAILELGDAPGLWKWDRGMWVEISKCIRGKWISLLPVYRDEIHDKVVPTWDEFRELPKEEAAMILFAIQG